MTTVAGSTTFSCETETLIIPDTGQYARNQRTTITPNSKSLAAIWAAEQSGTYSVYGQLFDPVTLAPLTPLETIDDSPVEENFPLGIFSRTFYDSGEGEEVDHIIFVYSRGYAAGRKQGVNQKVYKWHNNMAHTE